MNFREKLVVNLQKCWMMMKKNLVVQAAGKNIFSILFWVLFGSKNNNNN